MDYYAHSFGDDGDRSKWQPLAEHLVAVADLAERFAREALPADEDFAHAARLAGLLHDLGKYRPEFQAMLAGAPKTANTRHKQAGAARAADVGRADLAFAISGHHGGLPDRGALKDGINGPGGNAVVANCWNTALSDCAPVGVAPRSPPSFANVLAADVHTRLLFSSLVDADWQDTADFYDRAGGKSPAAAQAPLDAERSLSCVLAYIAERAKQCSDGRIAAIRDEVLRAALVAASEAPGLFAMTVPTGGGKTLSAMAFALAHAAKHGLRRVIYVAPYLSILEQNAREIRRALNAADDSPLVFEHHSLAEPADAGEDEQDRAGSTRRRAEAWDAPVIVTTNVQFFESLFANQPGRCRKLHNIARSVIILDECQTVPPGLVAPTCSMLSEFVRRTGATLVLSTATQPAWERRPTFDTGLTNVRQIVPEGLQLFERLRRVHVSWPTQSDGEWNWCDIAARMVAERAALCVVNTKGAARAVYTELRKLGCDDALHLSTNMCPRHRLETIDEVRRRLLSKKACRLVSTQLIEAGVDLDFPVVLRELAPLEAIIQAAGRANREGLLNHSDGTPGGRVLVFRCAQAVRLDRWYQAGIGVVETDFLRDGRQPDIGRAADVAEYFRRLYSSGDLDEAGIERSRQAQLFQTVAEDYRLIDDYTFAVVVATWQKTVRHVESLLERLKRGWDRSIAHRLGPFQVNVRHARIEQFGGLIAEGPAGLHVWYGPYDENTGITSDFQSDWLIV